MMNKTEQQLFALLRSGLWGSPVDADLFSDIVDWEAMLKMAAMQTVTGIVYDGIDKLPVDKQPPIPLMRKLYQTVMRIEQSHELLNKQLAKIVSKLQMEGINPVLLKGQGVAQNYPNPLRRQCGDIDLYVGKENCEKAVEILLGTGASPENKTKKKSPKHESFYLRGVTIELHFLVEKLHNPFANAEFQRWTQKHLRGNELQTWNLNGVNISLPPVNFNALYIFNHAYHHFIAGGIGLRQLCDWAIYLYIFHGHIDRQELMKDLKALGLLKPWQVFGCIVVEKLGLAKEDFPFYTEKYKGDSQQVLSRILQTGNFGYYNTEYGKHPARYLAGKLHSLYIRQKWIGGCLSIFPKESLLFYIYYWGNGISNILKGR